MTPESRGKGKRGKRREVEEWEGREEQEGRSEGEREEEENTTVSTLDVMGACDTFLPHFVAG